MAIVLDASATLPWRFESEATPWTRESLRRAAAGEEVIVPSHWRLKVAYSLLAALRRPRVTLPQVQEFCEDLAPFHIRVDPAQVPKDWVQLIALGARYGFTIYDAACLELSKRFGLALTTLDGDLKKAAQAESVPLV